MISGEEEEEAFFGGITPEMLGLVFNLFKLPLERRGLSLFNDSFHWDRGGEAVSWLGQGMGLKKGQPCSRVVHLKNWLAKPGTERAPWRPTARPWSGSWGMTG